LPSPWRDGQGRRPASACAPWSWLYLLTGRRRSEVLNLRWRDLDLEGGFYRYTGKGGKERQRALPPPVNWAIQAYARAAGLTRKGRVQGALEK
jgi:integrase